MPDGTLLDAGAALGVAASLSGRHWRWRPADERVALGIAQRLDLPELVGRLLAARGVGLDDAADFLAPTLRALLPDPSVLADMDAAAERLARAAQTAETVAVFGDYDVDGACAGALLTTVLRALGCTVLPYVPDRLTEGYGPNGPALLGLAARGATLVVCVDCGTAAADALAVLAGRAEVVILDHHAAQGPPPPVLATVNPNRLDCPSRLGQLCAAAVAFMAAVATVRVLRRRGGFAGRTEPDLLGLLDLVALATVCDVMPLTGLNRALVGQGLRVMARRARPGLAALLAVADADGPPSAFTCGFVLGPRINAAGRISECDLGLRLLLAEDPEEARLLARQLDGVNRQRQVVEAGLLDLALTEAAAQIAAGHAVPVVAGQGWHPGVVGIVAGRIKERFNRPACVAGVADGVARGSGRSVPGIDLGAAVIAARQSGLLLSGGGHAMAAGFSVPAASVPAFQAWLDTRLAAAAALPAAAELALDGALDLAAVTPALAESVGRLAPFGAGNPEPVFVLPRVRVVRADAMGREGGTLRLFLQSESGGARLKALLFRGADERLAAALRMAACGLPVHIAGHLRLDTWNGTERLWLQVRDAAGCVPP